MATQGTDRFVLNLQSAKTPEETAGRCMQELIRLVSQLNNAQLPVSIGPNQDLPVGMVAGQPVIDWSSGTSTLKVFDGEKLV